MQLQNELFKIRYVLDQYKNQQMCDKPILGNSRTLKFVPDCCENQEMCNKAVDNYPHALEFVPDCYITQKYVKKLLVLILLQLNMLLISLLNKVS